MAWILTGQDRASLRLRATSGVEADPDAMRALPLERSLAGVVVDTGTPVAVEDIATDPRALDVSQVFGWPSLGPAVVVPLRSGEQVDGALALAWSRERAEEYYTLDPALPAGFAEHATLVLQIVRAREDRQRLAMLEDRDRIGRELHDVVIQRLFAVGLGLQGTSRLVDRPDVATRLDQAVDDLDATIKDIRRSIFALASTDASHDIQAEVTRLVDRAAGTLKFRPTLQFEGPVRTLVGGDLAPDVLAVLGEALSNASRHAEARSVEVLLSAGERGRAEGHRRRPRRSTSRVPESGLAQHARAGRAPGRHVRGGVGPRRGHQLSRGPCPRADPALQRVRQAVAPRRGPLELPVHQRTADVGHHVRLGATEHGQPPAPGQAGRAGPGGRGQPSYLRDARVEDRGDRAVPRVLEKYGGEPLAHPPGCPLGCGTLAYGVGPGARPAQGERVGGGPEDEEVQVGGQVDRRRGHIDDNCVDAPVAETGGDGAADLLGVAEHRLHHDEGGGTTARGPLRVSWLQPRWVTIASSEQQGRGRRDQGPRPAHSFGSPSAGSVGGV